MSQSHRTSKSTVRRVGAAVAFALALGVAGTGCSGSNDSHDRDAPLADGAARIIDGEDTVARSGEIEVRIPAGNASGGTLQVVEPDDVELPSPVTAGSSGTFESVPIELVQSAGATIEDGSLIGSAQVTFGSVAAFGQDQVPVVMWEDAPSGEASTDTTDGATTEPYVVVPSTSDEQAQTVTASLGHFSRGFLGRVDVGQWAKDRAKSFGDYITGRSGVPDPECEDEDAARTDGFDAVSDSGDSVKWCMGIEDGQRVVKVANNRRTYTSLTFPDSWQVQSSNLPAFSWEALDRMLGTAEAKALANRRQQARLIDGGDTLTFVVPPGAGGQLTAEISMVGWFMSAIRFGTETYVAAMRFLNAKLGQELDADGWVAIANKLLGVDDSPILEAARDCTEGTASLTGSGSTKLAKTAVLAAFKCVPPMMEAYAKEIAAFTAGGIKAATIGAALSTASTITSLVLSGLHVIISGVREVWDSFASFGGNSTPIYRISIGTPTQNAWLYTRLVAQSAAGNTGIRRTAVLDGINSLNSTSFWVGCGSGDAEAGFDTGNGYRRLTGTLFLDSHTPAALEVDVQVSVGEQVIGAWTLRRGDSVDVDVNLAGTEPLVLAARATNGDLCDVADIGYGVFYDARLHR